MPIEFLNTKLYIPPVRPTLIPRPRLYDRLVPTTTTRVVLVSAPAGYGKTTLVAEWVANNPGCVAWLSLDAHDNNPPRFWTYVLASLRTRSQTDWGQRTLQILEAAPAPDLQSVLICLLNESTELDRQIILVLDDYHVISNQAIHEGMTFLIEPLPQQLELVITTRSDPLLPISRWRARGQLTELRADDLRFTADEAAAFLNDSMGLGLTAQDVDAIETRTEGWIAGLQLAALSLQGHSDRAGLIRAFSGSHRHILDYLGDEVLARQPDAVQEFLLKTCLLERLSGPLCDALLSASSSRSMLVDLEKKNLFLVPLDEERIWYRYHHLFAEMLRFRLRQVYPDGIPALHRRAAEWLQVHGDAATALGHALAIPDYAYASRMVIDNWRRIYHQGLLRTAVEWLDGLPGDFIRRSPPLSIAYGWTLFARGDYDRIPPCLDEATRAFELLVASGALPDTHIEYSTVMPQVGLLKAVVARHHGDLATALKEVEQVTLTVPKVQERLGPLAGDMGYTSCYAQMGYTYLAAGDWKQAEDYLGRVSRHARACANIMTLGFATFELARLLLQQRRLSEAEALCRDELALSEQPAYADFPAFCLIQLALADVLREHKRWDEALAYLRRGLDTARRNGHVLYLAHGYLIAARLHLAQGDSACAQADCRRAEHLAVTINHPGLDQALAQVKQEIEPAPRAPQPCVRPLIEPLSERELEVLRLISLGKTNLEIARQLVVAPGTVKAHAASIYRKLDVANRTEAAARARQLGLLA